MTLRSLALTLLCSAVLLLQGCSAWQVNQAAASLAVAGPQATLNRLEQIQHAGRDEAQYLLNTGVLKLYLGDWPGSRKDLEQAMLTTLADSGHGDEARVVPWLIALVNNWLCTFKSPLNRFLICGSRLSRRE